MREIRKIKCLVPRRLRLLKMIPEHSNPKLLHFYLQSYMFCINTAVNERAAGKPQARLGRRGPHVIDFMDVRTDIPDGPKPVSNFLSEEARYRNIEPMEASG
jgi:hypothetical protein